MLISAVETYKVVFILQVFDFFFPLNLMVLNKLLSQLSKGMIWLSVAEEIMRKKVG